MDNAGGDINDAAAAIQALKSVTFEGASGNVSFDEHADRSCASRECYVLVKLDFSQNLTALETGELKRLGRWDAVRSNFVYSAKQTFKELVGDDTAAISECDDANVAIISVDAGAAVMITVVAILVACVIIFMAVKLQKRGTIAPPDAVTQSLQVQVDGHSLPRRPSVDPELDAMLCGLDEALAELEAAEAVSDAYFTAFAPPQIFPDGAAFLLEVTAFALEYSAVVVEGAADRGKSAVSAKQRPVPIAVGTKMSVCLELPSQAFYYKEGSEGLVWDGTHCTAVFEVACLNQAEARRHVCKAMIGVDGQEDRVVLRFELNVVANNRVLSPPGTGLSSPASELAEVPGSTTLLPEVQQAQSPHIFISYRRTYFELADRVRRQLQTYGYRCFFDLDPQSGLGASDFQTQLESSLRGVPYLLAIITPAPSGEDDVCRGLSYTECIRHYAAEGRTDYCHMELATALADARTEVIPLFHPTYRSSNYDEQLRDLPADIADLVAKNAKPIGDAALFNKSIEAVHELIQRHVAASIHRKFQQDLERQLSSLSVDKIPAEGLFPEPEPEGVSVGAGPLSDPEGVPPAKIWPTNYQGLTASEDFRQVELAKVVHIISTPYDKVNPIAGAKAQATKNYHDNPGAGIYTFNPNSGLQAAAEAAGMSEEEQSKKWLELWTSVCKKVKETGGNCFVMAKGTDASNFVLEGNAQQGEVNIAEMALSEGQIQYIYY